MSEATPRATLTLEHTAMGEAEALEFLAGHRIMRGGRGQIHAFVSLTKAIPQGMDCTWEISDYLKERLHA